MRTLTHLYLAGGGLAGLSYVGAYECLEREGRLNTIMHFGGVSIGALFAALFAMHIDVNELRDYVRAFASSPDTTSIPVASPMDIWNHFGYAEVDPYIAKPIQHFLKAKYGYVAPQISFVEFAKLTGKTLAVTATNLATNKVQVFSVDHTPHACVIRAVCASACVPFLFKPVLIDDDAYVDGGVSSELPPLPFDETHENSSLALILGPGRALAASNKNPTTFLEYLKAVVVSTFANLRSLRFYKHKLVFEDNPLDFLPLSFSKNKITIQIAPESVDASFAYGYDVMYKYLTSTK